MNVSLTPELISLVQAKVQSGMYSNASEVIRDAIRQMDLHSKELYQHKLEALKHAIEPSLRQARAGEFADYSYASLMAEIEPRGTV